MHKILVPVDFSELSESALRAAANVAKKKNSEIYVLHVIEVAEPIMGTGAVQVEDKNILFFSQLAKKKLSEFLAKDYLNGINVTNIIKVGPTYNSITSNIDKFGIDLIVMGSKGTSGIEGFLIGSNTEKIVRHSSVPVLVIKNVNAEVNLQKIVFVSDFDDENTSAYKSALRFAKAFDTELSFMYVNTKKNNEKNLKKIKDRIDGFFRYLDNSIKTEDVIIHHAKNVEDGILEGANSIGADCIAMATHGRRGLSHLFNGSIAEDVVNQSKIPVLTFKIA